MKLSPRIARVTLPKMGRKREGDSESHLAMIRLLPCCVFGTRDRVEAHHLMHGVDNMPKGMGRKNEDRYALPLSFDAHHGGVHKAGDEELWLTSHGVQGRELAAALWACRDGDLDDYLRCMDRHFQRQRMMR